MWLFILGLVINVDSSMVDFGGSLLPVGVPNVGVIYREVLSDVPVNLSVKPLSIDTIFLSKPLPPAIGDIPLNGKIKKVVPSDDYKKDRLYPGVYLRVLSRGFRKNKYVIDYLLYPYQYNPVKKMLVRVKKFEIFTTPENKRRDFIVTSKTLSNQFDIADMVIITDNRFLPVLKQLKDWKDQMGVKTEIVTLDWIYSNYTGSDRPEKIRNFIKDAYKNHGVRYILLGGNEHVVPVREVYCNSPYYRGYMITDLYYADLDGTWDQDCDGVYGENTDGIDGYPDVAIGRLPFETEEEFSAYIQREKLYEKGFPFERNLLFMGASVYSQTDGWGQRNCELIQDSIPFEYREEGSLLKMFNPVIDTVNKLWKGDELLSRGNVLPELREGNNIIAHFDHGDVWYTGTGIILGGSKIYNSDMQDAGMNGIMISVSCYSNAWDKECFGEGFVKYTGLGYLGNIKSGWTSQSFMEKKFFRAMYRDSLFRLGDLWMQTLSGDIYFRYTFQLLGDPSLKVWWRKPDTIKELSLPENLKQGDNSIGFLADGLYGEGFVYQPKTGEYFKTEIVNGEGKICVTIPDTGMVVVGIVSPEYLPVIDTIYVSETGGMKVVGESSEGKRFRISLKGYEEKVVRLRDVYIKDSKGIIPVDSFPQVVSPGELFTISGNLPENRRKVGGNLIIKTINSPDSLMFSVFIPFIRDSLTIHHIRIGEKGIVEGIGIYNAGKEKSDYIVYGFKWWTAGKWKILKRDHSPLLPGEGFEDNEPIFLPAKFDSMVFFLNRDTIPFFPTLPVDSVLGFSQTPGPRSCRIQFNTQVSNFYNVYLDGRPMNILPLSHNTFEFTGIEYRPHILTIKPLSNSFVEGIPIFTDTIYPNPPEMDGWPVFTEYPEFIQTQETYNLPSPVTGDVDGDGFKEVIVQMPSGMLYLLDRWGNIEGNYPLLVGGITRSSPSVFDIDKDGRDEIVLNGGITDTVDIRMIGDSILSRGSGRISGMLYPVILPEGDIIYYTSDGYLHRIGDDMQEKIGWPVRISGVLYVASGNILSGDSLEIAVATSGNKLYILTDSGEKIDSVSMDSRPEGIACGDFDGDGLDEVAVVEYTGKLHIFNGDGTELSGFPFVQSYQVLADIGAGDLDGDGLPEVAFITKYGILYVVDGNGESILTLRIPRINYIRYVSPIIADLDGDGSNDILVHSTDGKIYAYKTNGRPVPGFPIDIGSVSGSDPIVDDLDLDGSIELIARDDAGYVHAYKLNGTKREWKTSGGDHSRCRWYELNKGDVQYKSSSGIEKTNILSSVQNTEFKDIKIYDVSGRCIDRDGNLKQLPPGVFFVKKGKQTRKLLIIR